MAVRRTIAYHPMVESVNRKFALRRETIGTAPGQLSCYMGGMTRIKSIAGIGPVTQNYMFLRKHANTNAPTENQILVREKFSLVRAAVTHIMRDITQVPVYQNMFLQAKDNRHLTVAGVSAYGLSVRGWIWNVCWHRADDPDITPQQLQQFPTAFDA